MAVTIIETITSVLIFVAVLLTTNFFVAGACVDKDKLCSGWASTGECTKNHLWMLQNCPNSCQVCSGAVVCVNIYNDAYCAMHLGNCWKPATARDLVKNCKKTCVCKCCPATPVTLPTTATLSNMTAATSVSSTRQTTAATASYSSTTKEEATTTMTPQTTHSFSGTEANTSILKTTARTINANKQDLDATDPTGLSPVLLSAIIAGVVAFIGVLGIILFCLWRRKRSGSLNQQKWPPLPPVQDDCIPTEEIIWLERQPRSDSRKPMVVSLDAAGTNDFDNQVVTKASPENPVSETVARSPCTTYNTIPFYHVLEEPDCSATGREQVLSVHYEQASERLRADSDYEEPVLQEARAAMGLPSKARENEAVYETANPKEPTNVVSSSNTLDGSDEYCYSYTSPDQDLALKYGENRPQEAPKNEDPNYRALEGPNAGYQATEKIPANGYTSMDGTTDLSGYQPLKKSARSVYQPLKKTNPQPRRAFTRK